MGTVKRLCHAQRSFPVTDDATVAVECERKLGHRKKHKASWRAGFGGRFVDIVAKWPRSS